jgi:phospholipid/cholesterol/gamma-HCH transport system substrate-binding protein
VKIKTEYKVGIIGVITIAILYFGIIFLKGKDLFNVETSYYAVFDDVSGLYKSNYIYLNGMKVGYIKDIKSIDEKASRFIVWIAVDSEIEIPKDSKIMIFSSDLLGSKALKIKMGISNENFHRRDTIESAIENGMIDQLADNITPIVVKLNSVMTNVDTLIVGVNAILDKQAQNDIKQSLENIKSITQNLENVSIKLDGLIDTEKVKIQAIIDNAESITSNFRQNNEKLTNAINNFSNISDTIAKANLGETIIEANKSLNSLSKIIKSIENGEGSAGLLIRDDKLYKNLETSTKKLDALIEDIKQHPKRYLKISVF